MSDAQIPFYENDPGDGNTVGEENVMLGLEEIVWYWYWSLSLSLSFNIYLCNLSIYISIHLFIYVLIYLFIKQLIYLSVYLSIYIVSIYPSICLPTYLIYQFLPHYTCHERDQYIDRI